MIKCFCDRCGKEIDGKVNEYTDMTEAINSHSQKVVATWKTVEHICDECEQKELTCGFKVGDKVITDDGRVGHITDICTCDRCKKRGFYEPSVEMDIGVRKIWVTDTDKENGFINFYQIGDRIFGNVDKEAPEYILKRIEELEHELTEYEEQLEVVRELKENNNGN
jgi:hypothetical protein